MDSLCASDSVTNNRFHGVSLATAIRACPGALSDVLGISLAACDHQLPLELRGACNPDILDFYSDLRQGGVIQRRCRVMLIGNGGAGKTRLARAMMGVSWEHAPTSMTHGVDQCKCCPQSSSD